MKMMAAGKSDNTETVLVSSINAIAIHADRFYDIQLSYKSDSGDRIVNCRLAPENLPAGLKAGDTVKVKKMLSTIYGLEKV